MKNCYPHKQFFAFWILFIGCCSAAIGHEAYQLSFDTIQVNAINADRYLFDMAVSEKVITLSGLNTGDHYELIINPYSSDNDCT